MDSEDPFVHALHLWKVICGLTFYLLIENSKFLVPVNQKGVLHTTAGYLLGATMTLKYVFDVHQGDIFGCMADVGYVK